MKLNLLGYFADNFGDDYMVKIIVNSLPEMEFIIDEEQAVNKLITSEKNVRYGVRSETQKLLKLYVTGSGFMINSKSALVSAFKRHLKKEWLYDYCLGCNMEPIKSRLGRFLIRKQLENFKFIVCRDKKSYSWLKKNIKTNIEYLPDILFYMPDEWIPKSEKRDKLGISVMNIGNDDDAYEYYKAMAEVADFYIEKNGKKVYLMAFSAGMEDDITACKTVRDLMKNKSEAEIIVHGENAEILKAYSECEKIIATRFHAAVLALRTGVDMFPIVYREKMENLLDDIGYYTKGCNVTSTDVDKIKKFTEEKTDFKLNENFLKGKRTHAQALREALRDSI